MLTRRLTAEGHLIDTGLMSNFFKVVLEDGGVYEVLRFDIGRTVGDYSKMELKVSAPDEAKLNTILDNLVALGCRLHEQIEEDAILKPSEKDGTVPDDFYSTTNHRTRLRVGGKYIDVVDQRMDAVIRVRDDAAACVKLRDVRKGDLIVSGVRGVQVFPPFKERETMDFVFMDRDVSSERRVEIVVTDLAKTMTEIRARKGRTVLVAGPVVVHTGGATHMSRLIREGFVQAILAGNALAVHDVERALYGTSLGVHLGTGVPVYEGHKNHMRAINFIRKAGSMRAAVES